MTKIINLKEDSRIIEEVPRPGEGGISAPSPVRCGYMLGPVVIDPAPLIVLPQSMLADRLSSQGFGAPQPSQFSALAFVVLALEIIHGVHIVGRCSVHLTSERDQECVVSVT